MWGKEGGLTKPGMIRDRDAWTCRINVPWKGGGCIGLEPVAKQSSLCVFVQCYKDKNVLDSTNALWSAIWNKVAEVKILVLWELATSASQPMNGLQTYRDTVPLQLWCRAGSFVLLGWSLMAESDLDFSNVPSTECHSLWLPWSGSPALNKVLHMGYRRYDKDTP